MKPKIYYWSLWVLRLFMVLAVSAALPIVAHGQATIVTPQAASQPIFTNQTTSANVQIKDFGQNVHFLTYASSTEPCMANIRMEESSDNVHFTPFSEDGGDMQPYTQTLSANGSSPGLVANGWFPVERVSLIIPTNVSGNNCTITATYSGSSTTVGQLQQGFIQSQGYRKLIALAAAPSSISTQVPAPFGTTAGRIYVVCSAACGSATFAIAPISIPFGATANGAIIQTITLASTTAVQTFDITPVPAESVVIDSNSPGSAAWITMYYEFISETDIGNTVNVNCLSGCSGGGGGSSIVWGPNAIGVAPTEAPVQVGGLNPSGTVAEIHTDAAGNQQVVGPTAQGTQDPGTNPVLIGGNTDNNSGPVSVLQATVLQELNPSAVALDVNIASTLPYANASNPVLFETGLVLASPATATFTTVGQILDYASSSAGQNTAANILVTISGTWTGQVGVQTSPSTSGFLKHAVMYPVLDGVTDFAAPVTYSISANGNYLILNGGSIQFTEAEGSITGGSAVVTISGMNPPGAVYVVQPTAGNLNATVICASGCLPSGGSNIVWGPNAVGVAPTEPPVLTGGINPSGNVETVKTDTTGNTQVVGPAGVGTNPVSGPVYVAGYDPITGHLDPIYGDSSNFAQRNEIVIPIAQTLDTFAVTLGSGCVAASVNSFPGANAVAINVSGTWTGTISFQASVTSVTGTYAAIDLYPTLTGSGGDGIITGPFVTSITANGNWLVFPAGMKLIEACGGSGTGAATVTFSTTTNSNATYALQPVAANLHARTEPNNAPSSACTPVPINFSSSGNNTIVAGVGGQQVRIYALNVVFGGAATVTFEDGASTPLTGPMGIFSGGSINLANEGAPQFITSSGNGFIVNLSAGVQASGWGCYSQF